MAVQSAGLEHRGKVTRLVHMMRGGDRLKYAHEEFPEVSVIPRSMARRTTSAYQVGKSVD
jgi:hypothetical protein